MDGIIAYVLSKKFTKDTVIGMGAIKGAACQVQSIDKVDKTTTITLKWEDNVGGVHTQAFDVEDGEDGISVVDATITANGHLELTLSDGNDIDCGKVLPQYDTMPPADATTLGAIYQYIGATDASYTNGYFYECVYEGGSYKWVEKSVQDSYTKIQIGDLSDLPDNTKNVIENIANIKLSVDQLSASKLSISDIDNALSDVSENPVQNKVITLAIDQLQGSMLDALAEKEDIFRYNTLPFPSVDIENAIVQYIGVTNANYTNGYYYQCVEFPVGSGTYIWTQKNVQPNNGGGGGGDGVVDGYYNPLNQLFYEDSSFLNPITGEDNTIYVDLNTNGLYRYNGAIFIKVSSSAESIQVDTMPTADSTQLNKIYQYIGATDTNYTNGYFYKCKFDGTNYYWDGIPTQDAYTKAEIGALSDLPDPSKTVTQNIELLQGSMSTLQGSVLNIKNDVTNLQGSVLNIQTDVSALQGSMAGIDKTKLDNLAPIYLIGSGLTLDTTVGSPTYGKLQATGMSIPIDDHLDDTSINPVQNKVISLTIDQMQGSILEKIQKKLAATADDFVVFTNDGDIADSGISKDVVPSTVSVSNKLLVASDLSAKADKVSGATDNDIALLDNTGNLKDSNKKLSDYQEKLTDGNGVDIDASNNISLDISYLTASRVGYIPSTEKGTNGGVATLDNTGKVPSGQLPSYVDDVVEGYLDNGTFYEDSAHTIPITPEDSKIYINLSDNTTYRWGGTAYVQISSSLALGTTHSTAYYGDQGKTAYDHSQIKNGSNPHNTTADNVNLKVPIPTLSGSKLDVESTLYGINTELGKKADKVASAISGHLAGLDGNGNLTDSGVVASNVIEKVTTATGLLKDDGTVDTTSYAPSANAYLVGDTAETTIDDTDYFPFYDSSVTAKRKTLFSSIVNKLKATFATLVGTATQDNLVSLTSSGNIADSGVSKSVLSSKTESSGGTDLSLVTTGEKYTWNRKVSDNPTFTQATNRANIASGESFSTLFGKIMKWFADLKDLAFISKPTSGQTTTWLRGDGTWVAPPNDNTWTAMVGATSSANGTAGYVGVNPPSNGYNTKYWRADGTWTVPPDNNTIPSAYCDTAAGTAAKTASCSGYTLTSNTYLHVIVVNANTSQNALTLNVNGKGAKPIYINGSASSSSNYTLPAGSYIVFYNGTNYYFRTDGALTTKGVYNINPSYGSYNINSQMPTTRRITKVVAAGSDKVGTWSDSSSPDESDWWQNDYFKFPASANSKNIDISFKFDPEYGQSEVVVLTGYILDTSTGKLCLRFGSAVTNAQLIAVDITYTPTYS